ncbi:hypothetical protein Q5P01_001296 [Channa striata]|uniref:Uncharacterized protein n=1 Tax=Channa striata TaxID=64152 RepID=A0AA88NR33_CHASR|nr:hypothetical protein Q5P01_001296 [Channa striata]
MEERGARARPGLEQESFKRRVGISPQTVGQRERARVKDSGPRDANGKGKSTDDGGASKQAVSRRGSLSFKEMWSRKSPRDAKGREDTFSQSKDSGAKEDAVASINNIAGPLKSPKGLVSPKSWKVPSSVKILSLPEALRDFPGHLDPGVQSPAAAGNNRLRVEGSRWSNRRHKCNHNDNTFNTCNSITRCNNHHGTTFNTSNSNARSNNRRYNYNHNGNTFKPNNYSTRWSNRNHKCNHNDNTFNTCNFITRCNNHHGTTFNTSNSNARSNNRKYNYNHNSDTFNQSYSSTRNVDLFTFISHAHSSQT